MDTSSTNNDEEKKVKTAVKPRGKFADEKYMGSEPRVTSLSSESDMAMAYNWFNYFYTSDDAKAFTISYLKSIKYDKHVIAKLGAVKSIDLHNIGWNCRLVENGSTLPEGLWEKCEQRIISLVGEVLDVSSVEEDQPQKNVVSIQDRVKERASELIGELEEETDVFFQEGVIQFDIKKWSLEKGIKPQIAKRITDHFRPQYEEICEALEGKDPDLVEAYSGWRAPVLKVMAIFIKKIIDHLDGAAEAGKALRKPRKKKVKPPSVLVSKMKYRLDWPDLNINSIDPKGIIGASQLWVINSKTRNLSVYHSVGPDGLSVRGSTITGYDEVSSITKKVRKPREVLPQVLNDGKVGLRSIMKNLTTTEMQANGRINADTILLRVLK
jgi:hypothetical protein